VPGIDPGVPQCRFTPTVAASIVPELGLLDAPFLFRDAAHTRAVLDGPVSGGFVELLRAKGAHNLAWAENGLRHVTANKPIRKPEDLHGQHIRVPLSAVMIEAFTALGANAEPLPFPQLFDPLRTGRFEARKIRSPPSSPPIMAAAVGNPSGCWFQHGDGMTFTINVKRRWRPRPVI
jgi:TRAP-type C4-dicarboxylate transport system substrate-binding protein